MKVVLKQSIMDKIYQEIKASKARRREIDYILLSHVEYEQLRFDAPPHIYWNPADDFSAKIETIDLDDPDFNQIKSRKVRFPVCRVIDGVRIVAVPEKYLK